MDIQAITPNYSNPYNKTAYNKRANVSFQAVDSKLLELLKEGAKGVDHKGLVDGAKKWGIFDTKRLYDIAETLLSAVKNLFTRAQTAETDLAKANEKINKFPQEMQKAVDAANEEMRQSFAEKFAKSEFELNQAKTEAQNAKQELAEMQERIAGVRPVSEIRAIMPDRAIATIEELIEQKIPTRRSMWEYLTQGEPQEVVKAQLDRCRVITQAENEGVLEIPEVKKFEQKIFDNGLRKDPYYYAQELIEHTIEAAPNGEIIESIPIREQIKKNAMAILAPLAKEKGYTIEAAERDLETYLDQAANFRRKYRIALDKKLKNEDEYPKYKVIDDPDFDTKKPILQKTLPSGRNEYYSMSDIEGWY